MDSPSAIITTAHPFTALMGLVGTTDVFLKNVSIANETGELDPPIPPFRYSISQMIIIAIIAAILSILTVAGNVMVMISFKIDKQLQTISNYFLFSLAVADFAIGLISMPLFTVSTILGYWPLGAFVCDTWLALDYLASNASVLNLLIISFDRYFSVTIPFQYRAKRTTTRASIMIGSAWGISLFLWPPWIYSWPYIEGKRTVPKYECYIQFIETNHYITFGTAIAAFYVPVSIMIFLYWKIWLATEKRKKELPNLQAGIKDSSKRSNSSDETAIVNHSGAISQVTSNENYGWRMPRSESSADGESVYTTNAILSDSGYGHHSRRSSTATAHGVPVATTPSTNALTMNGTHACYGGIREWCIAWWHSGRDDSSDECDQDEQSDLGYATPISIDTPLQSSVSRCTSLNTIKEQQQHHHTTYFSNNNNNNNSLSNSNNRMPLGHVLSTTSSEPSSTPKRPFPTSLSQLHEYPGQRDTRSLPLSNSSYTNNSSNITTISNNRTNNNNNNNNIVNVIDNNIDIDNDSRSDSPDSIYTILISLPRGNGSTTTTTNDATTTTRTPSIKQVKGDVPLHILLDDCNSTRRLLPSRDSQYSLPTTITSTTTNAAVASSSSSSTATGNVGRRLSNVPIPHQHQHSHQSHHHHHQQQHAHQPHQQQDVRMPLNVKTAAQQKLIDKQRLQARQLKKKKKSAEKRQESKAAKTLTAILLSFIITWTPYNILVLVKPLTACAKCIPQELWDFFYALCYLNSTINPMCYALCNASFRRTYVRILTCKWHTRTREAIQRGVYN